MDTLLGLLILAGFLAVGWGWYRLKAAARKRLNTGVLQRKDHALGQQLTSERLTFTSSRSPEEVVSIVRRRLGLPETRGPLPRLYLAAANDQGLAFAQGGKLGDNFRAELVVEAVNADTPDVRSQGVLTVLNWTEVDGIVGHLDDLAYLRRAIEVAVRKSDPHARFDAMSL